MSKLKDFFQNRAVAIALTAAICVGCVGYGMVGARKTETSVAPGSYSGSYYVMDEANVLSDKTESAISDYNFQWDQTYGSVVGAATVNSTEGQSIEDYTYSYGENWGLGENDMMILLDVGDGQWYFVSSRNQLVPDAAIWEDLDEEFTEEFEEGDYNKALNQLYKSLDKSYAKYAETQNNVQVSQPSGRRGGISGLGVALILALAIFILSAIDRSRCRLWFRRYSGVLNAPAFVPILFWHGINSAWFRKHTGAQAWSAGRTPHQVNPGAYTTYNGNRSRSYTSSGSRPGGFGGSGFGSSGSRSSFGSSGSRSSFGSSRGGGFGGSGRGGGSGFGGSRGGFGGRR